MSHITGQAFSTSGAFLYHPSDRVTLKVFGSYDIRNSYGMSTHSYVSDFRNRTVLHDRIDAIPRPYCNHLGRVGKDWSDKVASITPDDVLKQANINLFPEKSTTYSLYSPGQLEQQNTAKERFPNELEAVIC